MPTSSNGGRGGWRGLVAGALGRVEARVRASVPVVALARSDTGALRTYLRFRGAVEAALGPESAELYASVVTAVAARDGDLARIVASSLPDQLARVAPAERATYARLLRETLAVRPEAVPLVVRTLPDLVGTMDDEALRGFVAQGIALHGVSHHKAESFLRRESNVGQAAARALRKGLPLTEVQRTLSLYARAHCGEDVQVRPGQGQAFSDGHHVYLPEVVDRFGDERDFLVFKVQTAIAAGYLEFGSFNLEVDRLPGRWPERRQGETEVERFLRGFSNRSLARDLFQILEDARIEAHIAATYPGVARDLARIGPELRGDRATPSAPAARAVEALGRRAWGMPTLPVDRREDQAIAPLVAMLPTIGERSVQEVAEAVARAYPAVEGLMRHVDDEPSRLPEVDQGSPRRRKRDERDARHAPAPEKEDYQGIESSPLQPRLAPEEAGADERRVEEQAREILERMRAQGEDADRTEARRRAHEQDQRAERVAVEELLQRAAPPGGAVVPHGEDEAPMKAPASGEDVDVASAGKAFVYREWDATIEDYKPRWAVVREQRLREGDRAWVDQVMERQRPLIQVLRRRFEALRPQGLVRVRNLPDGDDLDIDRVVERRVARRAGQEPPDRLYLKRHREQRDVAVAFLLDMSSSTNESADGTSRRIIDVEKEALLVAAEALDVLGDAFAVWGFSGYGRENVNFYEAKGFEDAWDDRARERVGRMTFKMENRDGAAIRHATARLAAWPARQRLLFLLSDGKPLDCGCDHYFDRYAQEDTRVALREARQAGVHPFCITVDPAGPQYLARMYGEVAYTVIDRVEALPDRLVHVYRKLAL